MERRTIRTLAALRRRSVRAALVLVGALAGCSSAALLYGSKEPPPSKRPPRVTSTASAGPAAPAPSAPLALEQFLPFHAEPRFRGVADALQAEDPRRAADELRAILEADAVWRKPSVELWSGRLYEQVGDAARALAACERAARPEAVLREYAELCAARAEVAQGRLHEALARLDHRSFVSPAESERRWIVARAARGTGDRPRAIAALRATLPESVANLESARVALDLGELLLERPEPGEAGPVEALKLARRALVAAASFRAERTRAEELERKALSLLAPEAQKKHAEPSPEDRLARGTALLEGREPALAHLAATELIAALPAAARFEATGCDARLLAAKALAAQRQFGAAVEALAEARQRCNADTDRGARIWFLSGRYATSNSSYVQATEFFAELEKRHPTHSLTDDARFYAAIAQQELGVEARFTELLMSLPEDYPKGDMASEGLFRLALGRMERGAWAEAVGLLDRGLRHVGADESARGLDLSGRERYFRGRALLALGDREGGVRELEDVIQRFPLSYYMVHAYSRLESLEPGRGRAAIAAAQVEASAEPFQVAARPELQGPGFSRMMELLRIGELDLAVRELDALGLRGDGTGSEILWGIAMLYERAGFSKFSADLAKRRLSEVVSRWPIGGWTRAWQIAFPRPHLDIVSREAKTTGVDPALVYAVMREESAFDPKIVSAANAYGLMQIIVPTARMIGKSANLPSSPEALKQPRVNVALGCRILSRFAAGFEQNPLLAVPAYNAGPGRPRRWLRERPKADFDLWVELIPYSETRRYTKRVLSSRAIYSYLYEEEAAGRAHLLLPLAVAPAEKPM